MRKLKILAATLAMILLFAAPAFAQGAGDVSVVANGSGFFGDESADVEVGDVGAIATAGNVLDGDVVPLRKHGVGDDDIVLLRKHGV